MRPAQAFVAGLLSCLLAAPASGDPPFWAGDGAERDPSPEQRQLIARSQLETGRSLLREGRTELAEAALRRGLQAEPENAALHRELARVLDVLGREAEAGRARARADELDPPPPPLPDAPIPGSFEGVLVVLVPPSGEGGAQRSPRGWPGGEVARTLENHVALRLPKARVVHADFESVPAARDWLGRQAPRLVISLRVDRVYCGNSIKDGPFGMAWLRAALEPRGGRGESTLSARSLVEEPRLPSGCRAEVTARALNVLLERPELVEALAAEAGSGSGSPQSWSRDSIRALFPGLGDRIEARLDEGAQLLAQGRIRAAAEVFREAAKLDAGDPAVRTYLHEAEATLALSAELSRQRGSRGSKQDPGELDPRFSESQRAALEARLVEERRRREELLAALAVLDEDSRLPDLRLLSALRPVSIRNTEAFGPALARSRAGGEVEARGAYAPGGSVIAVYYFPVGDALPVLREEDLNQDGSADRWIAYAGSHRAEIWEAGRDSGRPDLRLVFSGEGRRLARIEIDRDGNGSPERVFHYSGERLTAEARDTNGDGNLDTFDRLDPEGRIALREEDLDGDGSIDVRSLYDAGRLVRRELSQPIDG